MFNKLRYISAGESHGPKLTAILDGMPAGLALDIAAINDDLVRRQQGYGRSARMKIEKDVVRISAGFVAGKTTGAPLAFEIDNLDYGNWKDKLIDPMNIPRPGHADLVGAIKYRHSDLRFSLERASARETAVRVCMGSVCKQLLAQFSITINSEILSIGSSDNKAMHSEIHSCMKAKDTLGGIIQVVALNVPPGLGSFVQWDKRLDAQIGMAMLSIPAMKGIEIGSAFHNATLRGSEVHDEMFIREDNEIRRSSNRAGGIEAGVSNGEPICIRVAMKPLSTTLNPRQSVDLVSKQPAQTNYERSDFCAVNRAMPIVESMLAYVLANALLDKLGGDSISEMLSRFESISNLDIDSIKLANEPYKFNYAY